VQQHYFNENDSNELHPFDVEVLLYGQMRTVKSAKGVFSSSGVDKGTAVLIKYLISKRAELDVFEPTAQQLIEQRQGSSDGVSTTKSLEILDLGCGWGIIALEAGMRFACAKVTALDINRHAVALTNLNAQNLGLANVQAVSEVQAEQQYDLILSNPPIRIGKMALLELLNKNLQRLRDGNSRAYFVIQKNLGADSIATELSKHYEVQKVASSKGFRILEVKRK
jgi:16S rRNA G1207 methylase RsmC